MCKGFEPPLIFLYVANTMGSRCNDLLKDMQTNTEIECLRQKQSLYTSEELESLNSLRKPSVVSFFSWFSGRVLRGF